MSMVTRWVLGVLAVSLIMTAVFFGVVIIGCSTWFPGFSGMMRNFASWGFSPWSRQWSPGTFWGNPSATPDAGYSSPYFPGMMGGMMGRWWSLSAPTEPLSLDEARTILEDYLQAYGNADLEIAEIMIFDNHAYAEVVEKSTGIGAFEVLVDSSSKNVFPEPGPNMMWNRKYGHMGGMMGWRNPNQVSAAMPISAEQSLKIAQRYLESALPGTQVAEEADPFYGYYTIHILQGGEPVGMLSVNGFNGAVWMHSWHGRFIEMSEEARK
jgi:hypothetical protein